MPAPIEVYIWPTPNGHKVTIALEEMGLPYVLKAVNIGIGEQFEPEFLKISPNNRMPAIIDPEGDDGRPLSIFESGAILQYLGRKSGQFYPTAEGRRAKVEEWLMWQMGGLGPMAGQAGHFRNYAPTIIKDQRQVAYGAVRYTNEVHRLHGVLNKQLMANEYVAGDYSIADMAIWPWVQNPHMRGIDLSEFPVLKTWSEKIAARPAVKTALAKGETLRSDATSSVAKLGPEGDKARSVMFGQRARP